MADLEGPLLSPKLIGDLAEALAVEATNAEQLGRLDRVWSLPGELLRANLEPPKRLLLLSALTAELGQLLPLDEGAPPVTGRAFLSYSSADREAVLEWRRTRGEKAAFLDRDTADGEVWELRLLLEILRADQFVVLWSASAGRSSWVEREARFARAVQSIRLGKTAFANAGRPYLLVVRLDTTPLATFLEDIQSDQDRVVMRADTWTVLATAAALGLAASLTRRDQAAFAPALLGALGVLLALNQYMSHYYRNALRGTLDRGAKWLASADVWTIIAQAEAILDRVYGRRLFSWRSLGMSALISLLAASPALIAMFRFVEKRRGGVSFPGMDTAPVHVFALGLAAFLAVAMLFDYLSLLATRFIISRIGRRRTSAALALGIPADVLVAAACVVVPLAAAGLTKDTRVSELDVIRVVIDESESVWGWLWATAASVTQLVSGQIRVSRLPYTLFPTVFVVAATCLSSAIFPSLVHLGLLFAGGVSHSLKHGPLRWLSLLLGTLHKDKRAPLVYLHAVAVGGVTAISLWPAAGKASTSWRPAWVAVRTGAGCLAKQELTQRQWRIVWDMNPELSRQLRLPREPSIFIGDDRPVETVSYCEALRFSNLWSLAEGLAPHYCDVASPTSRRWRLSCDGAPSRAFYLEACERNGAIGYNTTADGYRLPPFRLYRLLWHDQRVRHSQTNVLALGWFTASAGFRTHPVGSFPGAPSALPFDDLFGNVEEWSDDGNSRSTQHATHGGAWFGKGHVRRAAKARPEQSYDYLQTQNARRFRSGQTGVRFFATPQTPGCKVEPRR
jgi:formylglycine-generating enzyme required for sulfatase activity